MHPAVVKISHATRSNKSRDYHDIIDAPVKHSVLFIPPPILRPVESFRRIRNNPLRNSAPLPLSLSIESTRQKKGNERRCGKERGRVKREGRRRGRRRPVAGVLDLLSRTL